MAKKREVNKGEDANLDMTSMIDVTFLLIIFFMCVTESANLAKEKDLKLPIAYKAAVDEIDENGRLTVNITKKGEVKIMGQVYTPTDLDAAFSKEKALSWDKVEQAPTRAILFRVDENTPFIYVSNVMKQCMMHKLWKVMFATDGKGLS